MRNEELLQSKNKAHMKNQTGGEITSLGRMRRKN